MAFMPYLHFQGTCAAAMAFHADVFGATDLQMMPCSATPPGDGPSFATDNIMQSPLSVGNAVLMASDSPPGMGEGQRRSA